MIRVRQAHGAEIRRIVCLHFDLSPAEIVSQNRKRRIARPRQVAMHLARRMTKQTLPQIARHFGQSDHTTALHACRRIADLRAVDPEFNAKVRAVVADVHRAWRAY